MTDKPLKSVLATDCGSTTTKAILIELVGDSYRLVVRGEAPTTVEAPFEDVTRGVLNAIREVEEVADRKILDGERIITLQEGNVGVDLYLSTSSAGGGLQMGQVIGATDRRGERPAGRPYTPQNVLATLYRVLGIDPLTTIPDHQGRPVYLLDDVRRVEELG